VSFYSLIGSIIANCHQGATGLVALMEALAKVAVMNLWQ